MERHFMRTSSECWAEVDMTIPWRRADFSYLGLIRYASEPDKPFPWAWHADGRSIDKEDRAFDLIDFPKVDIGEAWRCMADAA